jgi:hypothetical protein
MKNYKYRLLLLLIITNFLFMTKGISVANSNSIHQNTLENTKKHNLQKKDKIKISGNYKLKYVNTLRNRKWKTEPNVGLDFFPNSYLYSVGNLFFNSKTSEVVLSSISVIKNLPSSEYGNYLFRINNKKLTIFYNQGSNSSTFIIRNITKIKLILEDTKTKNRWQFYKT